MEDQGKASNAQRSKPMLTVEEQISHLKAKGVKFDLCSEDEASAYLSGKCHFFKVAAYRKLFDKHVGGERDGLYVDLDFAQMRYLADLDRRLRDVLLPMTLDIEHFAAAKLLAEASSNGEDGYQMLRDYLEEIPAKRRKYIENELDVRSSDAYCGAVIRKYRNDMPTWAFVEVVSFGTFIGFMKYCAERWSDDELLVSHYLSKKTKSVRNAAAHSQCILNDLNAADGSGMKERVSPAVSKAIAECGVSRKLRAKKMQSPRMAQIATLLYQYEQTVPAGRTLEARRENISALFGHFDETSSILPESNPAVSSIAFIRRLTEGFGLLN